MAAEDVQVKFGPGSLWLRVDGFIDSLSRTCWGCGEGEAQGGFEAVVADRCVWTLQQREGGKLLTLSLPLPPASAEEGAYKRGGHEHTSACGYADLEVERGRGNEIQKHPPSVSRRQEAGPPCGTPGRWRARERLALLPRG